MTSFRAGYQYLGGAVVFVGTLVGFAGMGLVRLNDFEPNGVVGAIAFAVVCVLVTRLALCGIKLDGKCCVVRTLLRTRRFDISGGVLINTLGTLGGKGVGFPSICLSDGSRVRFYVMSGSTEGLLWDFENALRDQIAALE